jgi:hypothetical protein
MHERKREMDLELETGSDHPKYERMEEETPMMQENNKDTISLEE